METVARKDVRELPQVTIQAIILVDARIVVLHVHQIASKLVLKPVRMAARIVLPKVRDVRTAVPLVLLRAVILAKMDAREIVNLLVLGIAINLVLETVLANV